MNDIINDVEIQYLKRYIKNPNEIGIWYSTFILNHPSQNPLLQAYIDKHRSSKKFFDDKGYINNPLSFFYDISSIAQYYAIKKPDSIEDHFDKELKEIRRDIQTYGDLIIMKKGLLVIEDYPNYPDEFHFTVISLSEKTAKSIEALFKKIKYASLEKQKKVFYPTKTIYYPYFSYLYFYTSEVLINKDYIFLSEQEEKYFLRSYTLYIDATNPLNTVYHDYIKHSYENSMKMLGNALESKLKAIYSFISRLNSEDIPSLSMIQVEIEKECKKILNQELNNDNKPNKPETFTTIFQVCKEMQQHHLTDTEKKIVEALRLIAKELQKTTKQKPKINEPKNSILFPKKVFDHIKTVINFRNEVSHPNESANHDKLVSMLHAYIQISFWWEKTFKKINDCDNMSKKEILEEFIKLKKEEDKS